MLEVMRKIKLSEFIPHSTAFMLKKTGKRYELRAWNLGDAAWAHARYGEKRVGEFFGVSPDPSMIAAFAFRLMKPEDQDDFKPIPCRYRDADTGVVGEETQIGGGPLLAQWVEGPQETYDIRKAVMECIGLSQSIIDRIKKKTEADLLAGGDSSKKPSTDGSSPQTKSAS